MHQGMPSCVCLCVCVTQMLDRLYTLYVTVITTIKGYGDYFWVDVVEKIDEMGETVNQYQAQCKKLPKALREWPAYLDCRKTIDDFLEMLPLFQVRVCVCVCVSVCV